MRKRSWADGEVGRGERAARKALASLEVDHPTEAEIEDLAYVRGALVRQAPLAGAQARLVRANGHAVITISSSISYRPRQRFAIAHELGHLETHMKENQLDLCSESDISERYDQGTEREANAFASEFLMPRSLWNKRVDVARPTLDLVSDLAGEFEVSFVAAAIRFVKLCPERCALVFCQDGRTVWSVRSDDFGYWIAPRSRLDSYSLAFDVFDKGSVSGRPETISATAWLDSPKLDDNSDLIEHCRAIPSIQAAVSLLWIPADRDF